MPSINHRTVAATAAIVLLAPSPATAKQRTPCDRLAGRTLAANTHVRLYSEKFNRFGPRLRACSYRSRRVSTLWYDDGYGPRGTEPTTFTWAVNGDYAAVAASEAGTDDETDPVGGVSFQNLVVYNARTRRRSVPPTSLSGLRFTELVISPRGSVAGIGNPYQFASASDETPSGPLTESRVAVFEPTAPPQPGYTDSTWRVIGAGPIETLTGLAVSGSSVVWSSPSGIQQAALR